MDNAQKAIMIGVSVFIVIMLITAAVVITNIGNETMSNNNKQLEGVSKNVASQLLSDYSTQEMSGTNVIASVKKFYEKENFLLCVDSHNGICNATYQKFYSTLIPSGSIMLEPSYDGENYVATWFRTADAKTYPMFIFEGTLQNNTPDITNLSSKIKSTDTYMSYIIYQSGTDTILGIYFKKIS